MTIRAVFLDRDGTINVDKGYTNRVEDFEFLPGAVEALQLLFGANKVLIIVTNQAAVAKGICSEEDVMAVHQHMSRQLVRNRVSHAGIYFCPHHPQATIPLYRKECPCRKPNPGFLLKVMRERGIVSAEAVMIGDKNSDIEAGLALGLTTYLVETGHGKSEKFTTRATHVVPDLLSAAHHILG